jgi:hypothetical protein
VADCQGVTTALGRTHCEGCRAVSALLAACQTFIRDRGRHAGPHITAEWQPCEECERAYIAAEAAFDSAVAATAEAKAV